MLSRTQTRTQLNEMAVTLNALCGVLCFWCIHADHPQFLIFSAHPYFYGVSIEDARNFGFVEVYSCITNTDDSN